MLPNFRPPAECHSPIDDQPSPSADPPPPGRAWKRCQMNVFPVRGFSPWMAMRNRRPQPAITRSGQEADNAFVIASMISLEGWLVQSVTGYPGSDHTMVPCLAITFSGWKVPEFFGI